MNTIKTTFCGNKDEYIQYLRGYKTWTAGLYVDPDTTHQFGEDSEFYTCLVEYLNIMELKLFKGKWKYFTVGQSKGNIVPSGIKVCEGDKNILYLRSDQFGFSAPQGLNRSRAWDEKYPYAKYIKLTNDCDFVADVTWDTRSPGGSFIWPIKMYKSEIGIFWKSQYNVLRGVRSYIEDRVDLTLWEVKEFYDAWEKFKEAGGNDVELFFEQINDTGLILLSGDDRKLIFEWLIHFASFEKYVEFFAFNSFIYGEGNIINLINGEMITKTYISEIRRNSDIRICSVDDKNMIRSMLLRLQKQTNDRTNKIRDIINQNA